MANSFGKILLTLVAAGVAPGAIAAQDAQETFQEAIRLIRINKAEEGLQKLREVAEADPSSEEAFALWKAANDANGVYVWQMLLEQGGEYETIAKMLIDRATLPRKEMSRDQDAIAALIEQIRAPDFATRSRAMTTLAADYGEFAVPQLLHILGDSDAGSKADYAMLAVLRIGRPAVLPLIEALKSGNDLLRHNALEALVQIGDRRAGAAIADMANDPSQGVRMVAARGMEKLGIPQSADPAALYVRDADAYIAAADTAEASDVVWTWNPERHNVVAHDVPPALYSLELAKMRAEDALRIDPANSQADSRLKQAYLTQVAKIEADPAEFGEAADSVGRLKMAAMALGETSLREPVIEASAREMGTVVEAIATELGASESADASGLSSEDTSVRYATALSIALQATDSDSIPEPAKVVDVLGDAVTEEAIRAILVIDGNPLTQAVALAADAHRGVAVRTASTGKEGVADYYSFPMFDVVVVSEALQEPSVETVVNLIKKRNAETKVLLLAYSEDGEANFGALVDGVIAPEGDLTADELIAEATAVVDTLEERRARADKVAIAAGGALYRVAEADVSILPVADKIAAQLDRDEAVAIPAARALGAGATLAQAPALVRALGKEDASLEFQVAVCDALGGILARADIVPSNVLEALTKIAANAELDLELRQAAADALGRGKIDAHTRLMLAEVLKAIPEVSGE